jgi:hypothetical protein
MKNVKHIQAEPSKRLSSFLPRSWGFFGLLPFNRAAFLIHSGLAIQAASAFFYG